MEDIVGIDEMIEFGGACYIIDLDGFNNVLIKDSDKDEKHVETETVVTYNNEEGETPNQIIPISTVVTTREFTKGQEINGPKYDVIRMCLEILFTYNNEMDDTLGTERALSNTTIPFKVAFNTLLKYGILKEIEE